MTATSGHPPATRVVSLLPAATEMVAALGASSRLVGISHECDWPPELQRLPRLTTTPIDPSLPSADIDAAVLAARDAGTLVFGVDAGALRALQPDLLLTQGLCEVCAVADGAVHALASTLDPAPRVVSLEGRDLAGVWRDIRHVGEALGLAEGAQGLVRRLRTRLVLLQAAQRPDAVRPRVAVVEWLDPPFLAGHWVPDLVHAAGGLNVGARAGEHSPKVTWAEIAALEPDVIIVAPCGFTERRAARELDQLRDPEALALLGSRPTWVLDGNAYTARPGPRLVDAAELIRAALVGNPLPGLERWSPATLPSATSA